MIANQGYEQGFLSSNEVKSLSFEEAKDLHPYFPYLCGTESSGVSKRAQVFLGWKLEASSLPQEVPEIFKEEAMTLGLQSATEDKL